MGRSGYTSLSLPQDDYKLIRAKFDKTDIPYSFTVWATDILDAALERMKYAKTVYPHLEIISNVPSQIIVRHRWNNEIATITIKKGKPPTCDKKNPSFLPFALLHLGLHQV